MNCVLCGIHSKIKNTIFEVHYWNLFYYLKINFNFSEIKLEVIQLFQFSFAHSYLKNFLS